MQHLKCPVQHLHMSEDTGALLHAVECDTYAIWCNPEHGPDGGEGKAPL